MLNPQSLAFASGTIMALFSERIFFLREKKIFKMEMMNALCFYCYRSEIGGLVRGIDSLVSA